MCIGTGSLGERGGTLHNHSGNFPGFADLGLKHLANEGTLPDAPVRLPQSAIEIMHTTQLDYLREWQRLAYEAGMVGCDYPVAEGGGGRTDCQIVANQEMQRAGRPFLPNILGLGMAAPTIHIHGTQTVRETLLPRLFSCADIWCQGFSEPGAGSDLASLQTRAVKDGDEWVVNGQKVWTSGAQVADRGMLVARTNIDTPKHRGITYFIIDMDQPGIEIRPLKQMNGASQFNEVFFTDARVSDANIIGDRDAGWGVAVTTLAFERSGIGGGGSLMGAGGMPGEKARLLDLRVGDILEGKGPKAEGSSSMAFFGRSAKLTRQLAQSMGKTDDPVVRQGLAQLHSLEEIARYTTLRAKAAIQAGGRPGPETSTGKLAAANLMRAARDLGMSIIGAHGMLNGSDAPLGGAMQMLTLSSPSIAIAGGSDQIQRNIIGERVLGLPREPSVDKDVAFRDLKVGTQRAG